MGSMIRSPLPPMRPRSGADAEGGPCRLDWTGIRGRRPGDVGAGLPVRAAYAALTWVVVFFALHVYWYLGGSFGLAGPLPGAPNSLGGWIFEALVVSAFPLGAWVCLAIACGWLRGWMRRVAVIVAWLGCAALAVRGGAGVIDDVTRATGILPNGITGLSLEQTMGTAHPSASLLWWGDATDAYFLVGGFVFGLLAYRYRHSWSRPIAYDRAPGSRRRHEH